MMALCLLAIFLLTQRIVASWNSQSLVALLVVVAGAAAGGVAFSWRRYFGPRTR
jgi:hypothetical protein